MLALHRDLRIVFLHLLVGRSGHKGSLHRSFLSPPPSLPCVSRRTSSALVLLHPSFQAENLHTLQRRRTDTLATSHTHAHTHAPSCHPHHMHAPLPPATPAEASGLSHLLPAPAVSPSLPYPPSQHMQPLPWVRWSGHRPGLGPRGGGEGVHV